MKDGRWKKRKKKKRRIECKSRRGVIGDRRRFRLLWREEKWKRMKRRGERVHAQELKPGRFALAA